MKTYRILVACGSGIATSTVIANRVKNLCQDNGYTVTVTQVKITEVESRAKDYDLIVSSTRVPNSVTTPSVFAINYLTGVNAAATDKKILEIMGSLEK
ncbi:MAG: PTS sugar transporter subunit IIB [Clostridiales bacterium]|nr:PTS sugar transporter subunit IIB [Clostridiales bacterium]